MHDFARPNPFRPELLPSVRARSRPGKPRPASASAPTRIVSRRESRSWRKSRQAMLLTGLGFGTIGDPRLSLFFGQIEPDV
jgi:hypothetical protein